MKTKEEKYGKFDRSLSYKLLSNLLTIFILLISGCSTQKNTFVNRTYHNITAHYNAYFNGYESLKQGVKKINNTSDNFSILLPVFRHSTGEAASAAIAEMDKAILKASKVIKIHSITAKPKRVRSEKTEKQKAFYARKEFCNWVDDSYLMMGRAHFYKHDYFLAAQTFEYIIKEYNNMPVKYDGMIWLSRTYCELKDFKRAKELVDQIEGEKNFPRRLKGAFDATYADFYLKQEKYQDAVPKLEAAIKGTKKKHERARYKYILAQIYQQMGDAGNAIKFYGEVVKLNPKYEMTFSAKINRATSYQAGAGDSKDIIKQLNKMLKDDKNIEYQDQIYYALANIYYKEGNPAEAINYYKMSLQKSVNNTDQKALSYLALGDIYFIKPDYTLAQAYYDSSITLLDKNFPGYEAIELKSKNLTEIVGYINTVSREDSLQKIAQWPKEKREQYIKDLIEKIKEEEKKEKEEDRQRHVNSMMFEQRNPKNSMDNVGGKWYFYNPQAIALGKTQFATKWGNRKLEDNWRRKNKSIIDIVFQGEETTAATDSTSKRVSDNKTMEYYLQDLPLNDSLLLVSHGNIRDALYKLAKAYKEILHDYPKSIETYDELNKRYPENVYLLASYYDLYQIYKIQNNQLKSDYYKNLIITKFPDSKYAKILNNPDYFKELEAEESEATRLYEETYLAYKLKNFQQVINNCNFSDTAFEDNNLMPKFTYLKALSYGEIKNIDGMKAVLKKIIVEYPESDVREPSQNILAYLTKGEKPSEISDTSDKKVIDEKIEAEAEKIYILNENTAHLYLVIVENKKIDINRLKFDITNYNFDYYSMIDFQVSDQLLNDKYNMVIVKSFDNKEQAMNYYKGIISNRQVFRNMNEGQYSHFIISQENFQTLFKDQNVDKYIIFFNKHYQ
ncbi:MAG: tetratricopeptide repeat protein [Bacteroidia bacterium]|nr:tetratricopeptide repeat protein [Bacteroidia bacterium]